MNNKMKKITKFLLSLWVLTILVIICRTLIITVPNFQQEILPASSNELKAILIIASLILTTLTCILSVNITNFIIISIVQKKAHTDLTEYDFKNKLYIIYLLGINFSNIILVLCTFLFRANIINLTIISSLISYILISLMISVNLKEIIGRNRLNIHLPILIFFGNSITVLYMMLQ